MSRIVWFFILIAALFAAVHAFAVVTALYWYYPWFDIVMHFWGGLLIVLGVHALSQLQFVPLTRSGTNIALVAIVIMVAWEIFERSVGLFDGNTYVFDTLKDFFVGGLGVFIGYQILKRRRLSL